MGLNTVKPWVYKYIYIYISNIYLLKYFSAIFLTHDYGTSKRNGKTYFFLGGEPKKDWGFRIWVEGPLFFSQAFVVIMEGHLFSRCFVFFRENWGRQLWEAIFFGFWAEQSCNFEPRVASILRCCVEETHGGYPKKSHPKSDRKRVDISPSPHRNHIAKSRAVSHVVSHPMVECSEDADAGWLVDVPRAAVPLLLEDRSLLLGWLLTGPKDAKSRVQNQWTWRLESRKFSFNKAKMSPGGYFSWSSDWWRLNIQIGESFFGKTLGRNSRAPTLSTNNLFESIIPWLKTWIYTYIYIYMYMYMYIHPGSPVDHTKSGFFRMVHIKDSLLQTWQRQSLVDLDALPEAHISRWKSSSFLGKIPSKYTSWKGSMASHSH